MGLNIGKEHRKQHITVGFLFEKNKERLKFETLVNVGLDNKIKEKSIHRPGLALAGYVGLFTYDRVQVFGNTEIRYLKSMPLEKRIESFNTLFKFEIPCIVITNKNTLEKELLKIAEDHNVPVFRTPFETTKGVYLLSDFLDDQFSQQSTIHGSFVDVYGIGLLFIGRSGIGKSEIALDLVERGHRLVSDDVVTITRKGENILIGTGTDLVKHFMEIRGLGLIDVQSIFGVRAIRFQKRIEVVVELMEWKSDADFTRTGLDQSTISIMDVEVPHIKLPILPGKNVTVISEVIALNYLSKHYGYDAAQEFSKKLERVIQTKSKGVGKRSIDYFEHDFE
ncbi:MAG: HPr(Ser) kinase/phosphatase [Bacteriovoracaceae bacterium]|nr:HPr(Ser) kinase/phosphatase [Bacteroidota bacterium]